MTSQVHEFLKFKVTSMLDDLALHTGIEVPYNDRNVSRCVSSIEQFLELDTFNVLEDAMQEVDAYE